MQLTINGTPVFAATGGQDISTAKPLVIFLHGAGLDSSVWALHSRWFAHHGRSVLALDLPGHGRSGGTPLTSIADLADWLADVIGTAGHDRATLIGHSMGSLIALETASRHPQRVSSLGLIGSALTMPVHDDLLTAARDRISDAIAMLSLWGHGAHATQGGSQAPGIWMLGNAIRLLQQARPGVLHADLTACHTYDGGAQAARRIDCPTVVIAGERDMMTPFKAAKALAAAIDGAQLRPVRGAGHMLMAERPDDVLTGLKTL